MLFCGELLFLLIGLKPCLLLSGVPPSFFASTILPSLEKHSNSISIQIDFNIEQGNSYNDRNSYRNTTPEYRNSQQDANRSEEVLLNSSNRNTTPNTDTNKLTAKLRVIQLPKGKRTPHFDLGGSTIIVNENHSVATKGNRFSYYSIFSNDSIILN